MDEKVRWTIGRALAIASIFLLILLLFIVWQKENTTENLKQSNLTNPTDFKMCSCQERCLFDLESEYCEKHDCEIYELNVPPCKGKTTIVRRTTRQKIDYVIPPYDYAGCYAKCLKQNTTPLMP